MTDEAKNTILDAKYARIISLKYRCPDIILLCRYTMSGQQ